MFEILLDFARDSYLGRIFLSALLGALIGLEREFARRDPSLKTFTVLCVSACVYGIIGDHFSGPHADPTRIAGHVAAGIGFLGGGVIFKHESKVLGLTSAALVWFAAAIGVAVGLGLTRLAVEVTLSTIVFIYFLRLMHAILDRVLK